MRFTRESFQPDVPTFDAVWLCEHMRAGSWMAEAGGQPPHAHHPLVLLADPVGQSGMAVSLRSATLLQLNLGSALIERLAAQGCAVGPLAGLALHEILVNAAIHGNLEVMSGPSTAWSDLASRDSMVTAALANPRLAARFVTLAVWWDAESLVAVIADEGAGCPVQLIEESSANIDRRGAGRGLMIARAAAQVDLLNGGRSTRLTFARQPAAAVA